MATVASTRDIIYMYQGNYRDHLETTGDRDER